MVLTKKGVDRTAHDHTVRHDAMAASEVYERVKAFLEKDLKQRLRTFSVVFPIPSNGP